MKQILHFPGQVTESRGVKVYNVSSGKTLPQWLSDKKKKSLRKDEEYKSRIELIQVCPQHAPASPAEQHRPR